MLQLEVENLQGQKHRLSLSGPEYIVGRDAAVDIVLDDPKVSRRHARIFAQGGGYMVEDLKSANGVAVDGALIEAPVALQPGVRVAIGTHTLHLLPDEAAAAEVAAVPVLHLEPLAGPRAGQRHSFAPGRVTIGRGRDNLLAIDDASLSRHHAVLHVDVLQSHVEDLGSSNGTFVGAQRVQRQALQRGDLLRLGNLTFKVHTQPAAETVEARSDVPRARRAWGALGRRAAALGLGFAASFWLFEAASPAGSGPRGTAELAYQGQVLAALSTAQSFDASQSWDASITAYHRALDLDPANPDARAGLAAAEANRDQGGFLQEAGAQLTAGRPLQALATLTRISSQSFYGAAAQQLYDKARLAAEAQKLEAAQGACRARDFKKCQLEAATWLVYVPGSVAAAALVQEAEEGLRTTHRPFVPWSPSVYGRPATGCTDQDVRAAVLRYASGDVTTALARLRQLGSRPGAALGTTSIGEVLRLKAAGDSALAAGELERALTQWEQAVGVDRRLLGSRTQSVVSEQMHQRMAQALVRLGQQAFDRGAYAPAAAAWRRGLQLQPQEPALPLLLHRLASRAQSLLSDLGTLPSLDAAACARLQDVLEMTANDSATHRAAQRRLMACPRGKAR